jgi:malate dehydrogenase (oxaloacetate-decarboxylating)(NADP+)
MFLAAARTLAGMVSSDDRALGRVYPSLASIREVSHEIATAVATIAHDSGLAGVPRPADIRADIASRMFKPVYQEYV